MKKCSECGWVVDSIDGVTRYDDGEPIFVCDCCIAQTESGQGLLNAKGDQMTMSDAMTTEYLITKRTVDGEQQVDLRTALREITAEVQDDFARALEYAEQWRALTRTLRVENGLEITHFKQLVVLLSEKGDRKEA